jgi:hypothetical protein
VDRERLADQRTDGHPRVERGVRVLKDDLEAMSQRPKLILRKLSNVDAVEDHLPGGWPVQPDDRPPGRGLATAALADQPEHLAAPNREADPIDGVDDLVMAPKPTLASDREMERQVADLEQRGCLPLAVVHGRSRKRGHPAHRGMLAALS